MSLLNLNHFDMPPTGHNKKPRILQEPSILTAHHDHNDLTGFDTPLRNWNDIPPIQIMTQEQKESMDKALHNPLVLHKVIQALDLPELKICRLVNKTWKTFSNEVTLRRDCCQVRMTYDEEDRQKFRRVIEEDPKVISYYPENSTAWGSGHLGSLNKLLENSIQFPCSDFIFQGGNLGDPDPQKFFQIQGPHIRTLYLYRNSMTPQQTFYTILMRQAPKISNLTIAGFQYTWENENEEEKFSFDLPTLKIFEWGYATPTAHKILGASKNLQVVKNFRNCDDVDLVTKSSKVFAIRALDCQEKDKAETWTRLAVEGVQLQKLTFRICTKSSHLSGAFQELLVASKNSLQFLELSELFARTGTRLPRLENLSLLEMGFNSGQRCFQPGINLTQTFPHLRTLDCTGLLCMDDKWEKYFPTPNPFQGSLGSVDTLKICDDATIGWMQRLRSICPNFTHLAIQSEEDGLPDMLKAVFTLWPLNLTRLTVKFSNLPEEGLNLDSTFSGLPKNICDQLWSFGSGQKRRLDGFESWRNGPAITHLKGLKRLQLTMSCWFKAESFPVSSLSGIYGFQLLPDLKTVIEFDHTFVSQEELKSILTELGEVANIRHIKGQKAE